MAMPFNIRHLGRQAVRSVFGTRGTHRRLTCHRIKVLLIFWILFIPHQIVTRLCFFLDNIFFPRWRKTVINKPLFITGLFRSGTTFLHRLLAGDSENFSTFKTWEIYLAPSILQRKILKAWKKLDSLVGSPIIKRLKNYDSGSLGDIQLHQVGLWKEEEDEGLLLFLWDSLFTWFFFPDTDGIEDYQYADREMSPRRQKRKYAFYRACIRRHLYCHPNAPVYLSKNPAFTPKLQSLKEAFPDSRIVYLVRDPAKVLVSQSAWFSFCWHYFASPTDDYPFRNELLQMTRHWYEYPLEVLDGMPSEDRLIIEYRNLIARPARTIRNLYAHFNLPMTDDFEERLKRESKKTDEYANPKRLDPEEIGFSEEIVRSLFSDIYKRFDFTPIESVGAEEIKPAAEAVD